MAASMRGRPQGVAMKEAGANKSGHEGCSESVEAGSCNAESCTDESRDTESCDTCEDIDEVWFCSGCRCGCRSGEQGSWQGNCGSGDSCRGRGEETWGLQGSWALRH